MQFLENYPTEPVVVELKSKTLTEKLLDGVVKVCDAEARKYIGQKQVGPKFSLYLSLCACTYIQILNLLWFLSILVGNLEDGYIQPMYVYQSN